MDGTFGPPRQAPAWEAVGCAGFISYPPAGSRTGTANMAAIICSIRRIPAYSGSGSAEAMAKSRMVTLYKSAVR